jgi:D-aminoacyl-tRNA deacylase
MSKVGLVYSIRDPAGSGIANEIINRFKVDKIEIKRAVYSAYIPSMSAVISGFTEDVTHFDFLDNVMDVDFYVVLSRHSSAAKVKSLTTHHPGNPWGKADAGGRPWEISVANPILAFNFLRELNARKDEYGLSEFSVTYEVTHHGPSNLRKPITFIEIGSSIDEWTLKKAHELIADIVIRALTTDLVKCVPVAGFGGNHYAAKFTKRALETNECFGHIIAKYVLREIINDREKLHYILTKAIEKSVPPTTKVVVEKKAGAAIRECLRSIAKELNLDFEVI